MKASIDYDSLQLGKSALNSLYNEVHPSYVNKLSSLYEDLLSLDDNHDNCFSSEERSLYAINDEIDKNNAVLSEVSGDIESAVGQFVDAELGIINNIKLFNNEYTVDDINKIKSKGLGNAFLNRVDYYKDDLHGMYDNKQEGPLTEEDWKKQSAILQKLMNGAQTQRDKTVTYATYISTFYPNKLKYVLGGQHCKTKEGYMGLDSSWDASKAGLDGVSYMDCSAFVFRSMLNGGYNSADNKFEHPSYVPNGYDVSAEDLMNQGVTTNITQNNDVRAGDIVNISGGGGGNDHVGIIINVDNNSDKMTVAHSSGAGGMNLTTINMNDGVVIQDSNDSSREGKPYFQTVTRIPYEDEI